MRCKGTNKCVHVCIYSLFYKYAINYFTNSLAAHHGEEGIESIRLFRVEKTYAVKTGKWYFEFEAFTGGDMRVGWARPGCRPDKELGLDDQAFIFDGYRVII